MGHPSFIKRQENKQFLHTVEELKWWRPDQGEPVLDKLSNADLIQHFAAISIFHAQGPDLIAFAKSGRKDTDSVEGFGSLPIPCDGVTAFVDNWHSKGFEDNEIVALSYLYAFGRVMHPNQKIRSSDPYFDNYWYKHLMSDAEAVASWDTVLRDSRFAEHVELFAQDKKEFYSQFTDAWHKMSYLGHDESELHRVEDGFFADDIFMGDAQTKQPHELIEKFW